MSLKEAMRAGESGGRKAAVREEQLPSQHPLPKPTRDVSASNRSHSLTHDDPPVFPSHRRLLLVDREAEEADFEKQANVVYTRQFRTLAKLLGNEGMDFEELREKVEGMVLAERPQHDPQLLQRIHTLEWELSRRAAEARSSQSLPTSQEYLRGLETELGRKSKMINELSDSVKREAFEEAVRELQAEIEAKTAELKVVEEQAQEMRLRTNASLSLLEEELIRHKQTIQKLTFELDSQKRRSQTAAEDVERLKRREKQLLTSLESEGKAFYQGLSYSSHALLLQLEARDQQLSSSLAEQHSLQQDLNTLRRQQLQAEEELRQAQHELQGASTKLSFEEGQKDRLLEEIDHVTRELRLSNQAVASANETHQLLLVEKERTERELREATDQLRRMETALAELRGERDSCLQKMAEDEQSAKALNIQLQQAKRQSAESSSSLSHFHERNQALQAQLAEWTRTLQNHQEQFLLRDREVQHLRSEMAVREEEHVRREGQFRRREGDFSHREEEFTRLQVEFARVQGEFTLREEQYLQKQLEFTQKEQFFTHKEQQFIVKEEQFLLQGREWLFKEEGFSQRIEDFLRREEEYRFRESQFTKREEEIHQQHVHEASQLEQQIESLRANLASQQGMNRENTLKNASLSTRATELEEQLHDLTQTIARQSSLLAEREAELATLDQRIEAFEQEKELLLHRLDATEQDHTRAVDRERQWEEMARGRPALEAELATRRAQELQLRALLEQAAGKEAQLQAELYQRDFQQREVQEERKREHGEYEAEVGRLRRVVEELQEQMDHEKQGMEARAEEEGRLREQLEEQVRLLRMAVAELEERQGETTRRHAEVIGRMQADQKQLQQRQEDGRVQNQNLAYQNQELRVYQQHLTVIIEQHSEKMAASEAREVELERHFQLEMDQLSAQINELKYMIEQLKNEKAELERELDTHRNPRNNELASFTFNHYEDHAGPDLKAIIEELEQKLENYKREEEERIRLSYSNTFDSPALLASLHSERDHLQSENRRLEGELAGQQEEFLQREQQLGEIGRELEAMRGKLEEYERLLHDQEVTIDHLNGQIMQQNTLERQQSEEKTRQIEEYVQLRERYQQETARAERQRAELVVIREELVCVREAREVQSITVELERTKCELGRATEEIVKLRAEIAATFKQLEGARREAEVGRREAGELKLKAEEYEHRVLQYEHRVSELEDRRKREGSQQPHRILSRLSKRSNVSEQQLQQGQSKGSSDGQLSRRILNDPSKISGQESKFAHHLLVFENSKIHVTREPAEIAPEREIKEQRQEESVLSRQQQENRTPESSHRQINTTHTHFDRPSNDNSRRDARESQQFSQSRGSPRESRGQSNHSLTSIRQAEEVQEGSLPPAQASSVSSVQKEAQAKPKEYLPQQSSKKTISNANESKQVVSHPSSSKQSISSQNQHKNNIVNHSQSKQSVPEQEPRSQPHSFHRNSYQATIPIYVARPSALLPQERRESSQSQSGSKTKVRISYGQPADKSIEIKRREVPREIASSQVSRVSMQSNRLQEGSINQVSPISPRPHQATPSLLSSQIREQQSRPSVHLNEQPEQPTDSIINGINQLASRISNHPAPRSPTQLPKYDGVLRRESSPVYITARIETAHSPRHSNFISFNSTRGSNPVPLKQDPPAKIDPPTRMETVRQEPRKEELTVPPSKIVMRSVIGGKRNSLLNDTATFGKSSLRGPLNETFSQSNDSGIDVLQMDWMGPCCKNN